MNLIVVDTPEEAGVKAADIFAAVIREKPDCVLGLATGSTPLPLYRELVKREQAKQLSFAQVRTVNLDEYKGLSSDHPQSYRRFMQEHLFDHISIKPENTCIPDGSTKDPVAMCKAYEEQITQWGGIDLQLLSIGHDGHIGFNEPDATFAMCTHEVQLTEMTRKANQRFFSSLDQVPAAAFTMGVGTIMKAKKLVLLITGADKADITYRALRGAVTPEIPASILQFHPDLVVICDRTAAKKLYS